MKPIDTWLPHKYWVVAVERQRDEEKRAHQMPNHRFDEGAIEMVATWPNRSPRDGEFYWIKETPNSEWTVGKRDSNADEEGGWYIEGWEHPVGAYEVGPHIPRPRR